MTEAVAAKRRAARRCRLVTDPITEGMAYLERCRARSSRCTCRCRHHRGADLPVLLDGADGHQAGRAADRHGDVQPVLDVAPT